MGVVVVVVVTESMNMEKLMFCRNCSQSLFRQLHRQDLAISINKRCISTSLTLHKRQSKKYRPKLQPLWKFGATHRFMRGLDVEGGRYGILLDRPDYTFLDGRPTPLTPDQAEERSRRVDMARKVMMGMSKMDTAKQTSEKIFDEIEEEKNRAFPLKAKS